MVHCGQGSSARLRFWTKTLFRRGTMNAIIGVMSALNPLGRISTARVNRVPSPAGSTVYVIRGCSPAKSP